MPSVPSAHSSAPARWPRPLGGEPLYVARAAVLARLDGARGQGTAELDPAARRAAYLTAVVLGLQIPRAATVADVAPWDRSISLDAPSLAARAGCSPADCERGLELLRAAAVLVPDPSAPDEHAHFAPDVFVARPTAAAIDWETVLAALHGNAAAILATWALAELLKRPDRFAAVPRAVLQAHTLYGEGMVKRALATLVARGIVDRSPPNAFRFSDLALGRAPLASAERLVKAVPEPRTPDPDPRLLSGPQPQALVHFTAAGIPLALPRDTTVELETEIDGRRTTLRLRFPAE